MAIYLTVCTVCVLQVDWFQISKCLAVSCAKRQLSSVKEFFHYLRHRNLLYEPTNLSCAEDECCRSFSRYNLLYRHLTTVHGRHASPDSYDKPSTSTDSSVSSNADFDTNPTELRMSGQVNSTHENIGSSPLPGIDEIKLHAANFLPGLTTSSSINLSWVDFVRNSVNELLTTVIDSVKTHACSVFSELPVAADTGTLFMRHLMD